MNSLFLGCSEHSHVALVEQEQLLCRAAEGVMGCAGVAGGRLQAAASQFVLLAKLPSLQPRQLPCKSICGRGL